MVEGDGVHGIGPGGSPEYAPIRDTRDERRETDSGTADESAAAE